MEISPAFQCYPKDWLAMTQGFTGLSFEILVKSVWFFWLSEKQPKLENDDEIIAFTLGVEVDEWSKVKRIALKKGIFLETEDGFITAGILLKEYEKQAQRRSASSENGKKGGRPKKEETQEKGLGFEKKAKKSFSSPSPISSSKEYENDFSVWWSCYPEKKEKSVASKSYKKAREEADAETLLKGLELYVKNKPSWKEWKMPATWLNKKCWNDDYSSDGKVINIQAGIPQKSVEEQWADIFAQPKMFDMLSRGDDGVIETKNIQKTIYGYMLEDQPVTLHQLKRLEDVIRA